MVPHVNGSRLLRTIRDLSQIGRVADEGISRFTLTESDLQARRYVKQLMEEAGLSIRIDEFANIIGSNKSEDTIDVSPVLCGSHIDTVPRGGPLDGAYGVLSAIEAARTINENQLPSNKPIEVVVFTEEEGRRFPSFIGSLGLTGSIKKEDAYRLKDREGVSFGDAMANVGLTPSELSHESLKTGNVAAYVELHIEQGPVLETEQISIGIVDSIVGVEQFIVKLEGEAGHAGTSPMNQRHDTLVATSRIVLGIDHLAKEHGFVATVGSLALSPNAANVIPGETTFSVDFRDVETYRLLNHEKEILSLVQQVADEEGLTSTVLSKTRSEPAMMSPRVMTAIASASDSLSLTHTVIHSGAGHDCQIMAKFTETGMIFVPSHGGVSHAPSEYTPPEDLVNGANVLLNTILRLANTE